MSSWSASVRPGVKGTDTSCPALFAARSIAAQPPSTITSANETNTSSPCVSLKSFWIPSRVRSTMVTSAESLISQSFWGASRMRAPLAPPRLSVPRNVAAEAHAVATSWDTESPEARIRSLSSATCAVPIGSCVASGTGSCHDCGSEGTHGPRLRVRGPMSRCVSLYQALAKASSN